MNESVITLLYFAYGSNLLGQRLLIANPKAVRAGIGLLKDHRLDFYYYSNRWGGDAATIVPHAGKEVWGALWLLPQDHIASLDDQEGVSSGVYEAKQVSILKPNNETVTARTYQLVELPSREGLGKPSQIYLETILQGAKESELPSEYFKRLEAVKHNGFQGPINVKGLNISFIFTKKLDDQKIN